MVELVSLQRTTHAQDDDKLPVCQAQCCVCYPEKSFLIPRLAFKYVPVPSTCNLSDTPGHQQTLQATTGKICFISEWHEYHQFMVSSACRFALGFSQMESRTDPNSHRLGNLFPASVLIANYRFYSRNRQSRRNLLEHTELLQSSERARNKPTSSPQNYGARGNRQGCGTYQKHQCPCQPPRCSRQDRMSHPSQRTPRKTISQCEVALQLSDKYATSPSTCPVPTCIPRLGQYIFPVNWVLFLRTRESHFTPCLVKCAVHLHLGSC